MPLVDLEVSILQTLVMDGEKVEIPARSSLSTESDIHRLLSANGE
jgi:hypothetical protein